MKKCELMAIDKCELLSICGIPIKNQVTYLGVIITKDHSVKCSLNVEPIIEKTRKKFNSWLQIDLSLRGRCHLSKADGISRLTYAALPLAVEIATAKDKLVFGKNKNALCQRICYNE